MPFFYVESSFQILNFPTNIKFLSSSWIINYNAIQYICPLFSFFASRIILIFEIFKKHFFIIIVGIEMSHVRQRVLKYVVLFHCSLQSVGRVRRYARSIGKMRGCTRDLRTCAFSYNHQAAIHHRSLCWVTWSPVFPPPRVFLSFRVWYSSFPAVIFFNTSNLTF